MAKRPRDPNQLAKFILDIAIGEGTDTVSSSKKNVERKGRSGGLVGGKSRARTLTPDERHEIARLGKNANIAA
jgi:hypothetical protein